MKWGRRRTPAQLGSRPSIRARLKARSEAKAKIASKAVSGHKLDVMSTADLKVRIDRLNMEKQYKALLADLDVQKESRIKKLVKDSLESGAKTLANAAFQKLAKNMFDKTDKEQDKRTNWSKVDPTKLGDKAFETYVSRKKSESALAKYLDAERKAQEDKDAEIQRQRDQTGKGFVSKTAPKTKTIGLDSRRVGKLLDLDISQISAEQTGRGKNTTDDLLSWMGDQYDW